jgi:hypothetical protein
MFAGSGFHYAIEMKCTEGMSMSAQQWAMALKAAFSWLCVVVLLLAVSQMTFAQKVEADQKLEALRAEVSGLHKQVAKLRASLLQLQGEAANRKGKLRDKTWPAIPIDALPLSNKKLAGREKLVVDRRRMLDFVVADARELRGVVVDNTDAELVGTWQHSVHTPGFVGKGYIHDQNKDKGAKSVTYRPVINKAGMHEVRMSHNANSARSTKVTVTIHHAGGETIVHVNQHNHPPLGLLFRSLGRYRLMAGRQSKVVISNAKTDGGYVIADAMWFVPVGMISKDDVQSDRENRVPEVPKALEMPRMTGSQIRKVDVMHVALAAAKQQLDAARAKLAAFGVTK